MVAGVRHRLPHGGGAQVGRRSLSGGPAEKADHQLAFLLWNRAALPLVFPAWTAWRVGLHESPARSRRSTDLLSAATTMDSKSDAKAHEDLVEHAPADATRMSNDSKAANDPEKGSSSDDLSSSPTAREERKIVLKLDSVILPLTALLYVRYSSDRFCGQFAVSPDSLRLLTRCTLFIALVSFFISTLLFT
jgi:hypothetical protein